MTKQFIKAIFANNDKVVKLSVLSFLSVITLTFSQAKAQNLKPEDQIYSAVVHGILSEGAIPFDKLPKEKQAILFSIVVKIDNLGKVENVEFTNPSNHADSLIRYTQVTNEIKRDKKNILKQYKNSIYVLPILITKDGNNNILITPEFLADFEKLIPKKDQFDKSKSLNITRTYSIKIGDIHY
ncbi:hypothetical protein HDF26_004560 [Pedobacter cryoconitis]|uniref:hypothetical protein n=1 Tax=Pedobacter cryoconitis TaxID=188932 RepID=UPI00161DA423|nr:hypothetical protein [Pedobacter cryoconitis]MBB6274087.1 hypothetical protein [Pedobacter cryoconitis]